jgi:hypothetical protein
MLYVLQSPDHNQNFFVIRLEVVVGVGPSLGVTLCDRQQWEHLHQCTYHTHLKSEGFSTSYRTRALHASAKGGCS